MFHSSAEQSASGFIQQRREKQMYDYTQDNLTISNNCYACMLLDAICQECEDSKDAKLTDRAWEIVDEGNLQYKLTLSYNQAMPSGHDWTEREGEFKPPIVQLVDGMNEELAMHLGSLWELEDERQRQREVECQWCHILTPKVFNDCQSCDGALEHNVR